MLTFLLYESSLLVATAFVSLLLDYARGIPPLWSRKNIDTFISSNLSLNDTTQNSLQTEPHHTEHLTAAREKQHEEAGMPTGTGMDQMQSAHIYSVKLTAAES